MGFAMQRNARDVEYSPHGGSIQIHACDKQIEKSAKNDESDFSLRARNRADAPAPTRKNFSLIIEILSNITPH